MRLATHSVFAGAWSADTTCWRPTPQMCLVGSHSARTKWSGARGSCSRRGQRGFLRHPSSHSGRRTLHLRLLEQFDRREHVPVEHVSVLQSSPTASADAGLGSGVRFWGVGLLVVKRIRSSPSRAGRCDEHEDRVRHLMFMRWSFTAVVVPSADNRHLLKVNLLELLVAKLQGMKRRAWSTAMCLDLGDVHAQCSVGLILQT